MLRYSITDTYVLWWHQEEHLANIPVFHTESALQIYRCAHTSHQTGKNTTVKGLVSYYSYSLCKYTSSRMSACADKVLSWLTAN